MEIEYLDEENQNINLEYKETFIMSNNRNAALDFKIVKVSIKNGRVYGLDCNVDSNSSYNG